MVLAVVAVPDCWRSAYAVLHAYAYYAVIHSRYLTVSLKIGLQSTLKLDIQNFIRNDVCVASREIASVSA